MKIFSLMLLLLPLVANSATINVSQWVNPATQTIMSGGQVMYKLNNADIVLIGEQHNSLLTKQLQLIVLKKMHNSKKRVVLAMEAFDWKDRSYLEKYATGKITFDALIKLSNQVDAWGFDPELIRPLVEYAKANQIKIIGIRAPKFFIDELKNLETFAEFEAYGLPAPIGMKTDYLKYLYAAMSTGHSSTDMAAFKTFAKAQVAMDVTMAVTISFFAPQYQAVVILGSGHVMFGWGVESRLDKGLNVVSIIPIEVELDIKEINADYATMLYRTK